MQVVFLICFFVVYQFSLVYEISLHYIEFNLNKTFNRHRITITLHNNLVKNINVIINLIDVTSIANHFQYIGIHYLITNYGFTSLYYQNYYQFFELCFLIMVRHFVHFESTSVHLVHFGPSWSTLVYFDPIWLNLIHYGPLRSIWSIQSNFILFGPILSIQSTSVFFIYFSLNRSIQSNLVQFNLFKSIQTTLVHLKNEKTRIRVESTINY